MTTCYRVEYDVWAVPPDSPDDELVYQETYEQQHWQFAVKAARRLEEKGYANVRVVVTEANR